MGHTQRAPCLLRFSYKDLHRHSVPTCSASIALPGLADIHRHNLAPTLKSLKETLGATKTSLPTRTHNIWILVWARLIESEEHKSRNSRDVAKHNIAPKLNYRRHGCDHLKIINANECGAHTLVGLIGQTTLKISRILISRKLKHSMNDQCPLFNSLVLLAP